VNKAKNELGFEESIETHLLASGWISVPNASYDAVLGVVPDEMKAFLKASQPDEWDLLVTRVGAGSEVKAAEKVVAYVAQQVDKRGTVHVLRHPTKMNGVEFRLAFFAPANTLTTALRERYEANRLGVARHQRSAHGDGGVEEPAYGADGRGCDAAVPGGPEAVGVDVP
jgi:type I restriction enzyme R subunit